MDEMTLIRDFRNDLATPGPSERTRRRVTQEIRGTRSRQRRGLRLTAATGVAAAAATVLAVLGPAGPGAAPSAAAVLEQAAATVRSAGTQEPAPTQWIFESWQHAGVGGAAPTTTGEAWTRFDGEKFADHLTGSTRINVQPLVDSDVLTPQEWYDYLDALPADPQALLAELRDGGVLHGRGGTEAARDFDAVTQALADPRVMPADAHARLFRALGTVPGVGIDEHAKGDLLGRPVISVTFAGLTQAGSTVRNVHELLLDPVSYDYRGERVTALEDGVLPGGTSVSEGETWFNGALVDTGVVDRPGQRP